MTLFLSMAFAFFYSAGNKLLVFEGSRRGALHFLGHYTTAKVIPTYYSVVVFPSIGIDLSPLLTPITEDYPKSV